MKSFFMPMQEIQHNPSETNLERKVPHQLEPNLATVFGKLRLMAMAMDTHGATNTGIQEKVNGCYETLIDALDSGRFAAAKKCLRELRALSSTVKNTHFASTLTEVTKLTNNIPQLRVHADEIENPA